MSPKDDYCYRILKTYSLLVDYEGKCKGVNVPRPKEGETFKAWKIRVLGSGASGVKIFTPVTPASQTKISTLQSLASGEHFERMFNARQRGMSAKIAVAVDDAVVRAEQKFSTIPKDTLRDILQEKEYDLEPSVRQFFDKFDAEVSEDVDIERLLRKLIHNYNNAVRYGKKKQLHHVAVAHQD